MNYPIITVTLNPSVDKSMIAQRVIPNRKLTVSDVRNDPGGGGINVARAISKLGGKAYALWSTGGSFGEILERLLDAESLDQRPIPIEGLTRENVIVTDRSSGEQYRFGLPGSTLSKKDQQTWVSSIGVLSPVPKFLVLSGSLPGETPPQWYADFIRSADRQTAIIVDTKKQALHEALRVGVYLIKPNVQELEEVVGRELCDDKDIERAGRELIAKGSTQIIVVSLGRGGAMLVTRDHARRFLAPSVKLRSKVGAGDSMVGGLVKALAEGRDIDEAVRYGVAAGAAAVMTHGTELCRRDDAERLVDRVEAKEHLNAS